MQVSSALRPVASSSRFRSTERTRAPAPASDSCLHPAHSTVVSRSRQPVYPSLSRLPCTCSSPSRPFPHVVHRSSLLASPHHRAHVFFISCRSRPFPASHRRHPVSTSPSHLHSPASARLLGRPPLVTRPASCPRIVSLTLGFSPSFVPFVHFRERSLRHTTLACAATVIIPDCSLGFAERAIPLRVRHGHRSPFRFRTL